MLVCLSPLPNFFSASTVSPHLLPPCNPPSLLLAPCFIIPLHLLAPYLNPPSLPCLPPPPPSFYPQSLNLVPSLLPLLSPFLIIRSNLSPPSHTQFTLSPSLPPLLSSHSLSLSALPQLCPPSLAPSLPRSLPCFLPPRFLPPSLTVSLTTTLVPPSDSTFLFPIGNILDISIYLDDSELCCCLLLVFLSSSSSSLELSKQHNVENN